MRTAKQKLAGEIKGGTGSSRGRRPRGSLTSVGNPHMRSARRVFAAAKRGFKESSGPKDDKAAFSLLREAAEMGSIGAHEWLGYVYDYGYGTRPNRRLAFEHYMLTAKAGNANAEYHVGVFYQEGKSSENFLMRLPMIDAETKRWPRFHRFEILHCLLY